MDPLYRSMTSCAMTAIKVFDLLSAKLNLEESYVGGKFSAPYHNSWCFRVPIGGDKTLSVSVPPDAGGNQHQDHPVSGFYTAWTIETALMDTNGKIFYDDDLGYDNVRRFGNGSSCSADSVIGEVVVEILRLQKNFLSNGVSAAGESKGDASSGGESKSDSHAADTPLENCEKVSTDYNTKPTSFLMNQCEDVSADNGKVSIDYGHKPTSS